MTKKIILQYLWLMVKLKIRKNPKIIAITGSAGKTSTRLAISTLLEQKYDVSASVGNLNSEFGTAYVLLGLSMPEKRSHWFGIICKSMLSAIFPINAKKIIILELGADKPGDIAFFCQKLKISVAVLTNIGIAHIANYGSREKILKEKMTLAKSVKGGLVIYNGDDLLLDQSVRAISDVEKISFGQKKSDCQISKIKIGINGLRAQFHTEKDSYSIQLTTINKAMLWSVAPAIALSEKFDLTQKQILKGLKKIKIESGRGRLIKGMNHSTIIDHSYNANPISVRYALESFDQIDSRGDKYLVIGDMAELGHESSSQHEKIGDLIKKIKCQSFSYGEEAKKYKIKHYSDQDQIIEILLNKLKQNDIVLIIGSQIARGEKIIQQIMANPEEAKDQLVRQSNYWRTN